MLKEDNIFNGSWSVSLANMFLTHKRSIRLVLVR